ILIAVSYPIVRLWMTQNLWPTNYVAIVIVLTGFLLTGRKFFIPTALVIAGGWTFAAWPMLQGDIGFQSGGAIGFSLLCSAALFEIRSRRLALFERSEEHTSELQSRSDLVCRLLLEKKKKKNKIEVLMIYPSLHTAS